MLAAQRLFPLVLLGRSLQPMGLKQVALMRETEQMRGKYTQRGKLPRNKANGKVRLGKDEWMFLPQSLKSEHRVRALERHTHPIGCHSCS